MKNEKNKCCKCGSPHVVNKKFILCSDCNYFRMHGKSRYEVSREKKKKRDDKPKKIYRFKTKVNYEKINAYKEFDKKKQDEDEVYCTGCGTTSCLSHSHLVPISFNKDLEADINNLTYHCLAMEGLEGCHNKWESRDIELMLQLNDFEVNLEKVRELDYKYYLTIKERLDAR